MLDVRDALQRTAARPSALLELAEQDSVARALDPHLTADGLRGGVARAGRVVAHALDTAMRRALGNLPGRRPLPPVMVRGRRRGPRLEPLAAGLARLGGEVVLDAAGAPLPDAVLPLRAARVAAEGGLGFEPLTLEALGSAPPLGTPWPAEARAELGGFLVQGPRVAPVWEALDQAGAVTRLWPEWAAVRNQVQRNPLHLYTVDRHSVEAVGLLGGIDVGAARRDLTAVATLFHDLGKRPGAKDHAGLGALLAGPLFARLGYPAEEAEFMTELIRHHLTLARLATTRDPAAPETLAELLDAVDGRLERLDGLAALTEADARAAGPKAWTKQRAALVARLTALARARLTT
ncbi:MAG: HD domain-containing protein [Bifidobacteriaceae bacterium]|jgi:[protein-PII] uridylyltransferase|nr:HD domain-containing protein [Bifidobacteriaceae bacterium]